MAETNKADDRRVVLKPHRSADPPSPMLKLCKISVKTVTIKWLT